MAASLTLLLGSSFLMPWMMAVRIWLALSWRCSGSCQSVHKVNQTDARKHGAVSVCWTGLTMSWQM